MKKFHLHLKKISIFFLIIMAVVTIVQYGPPVYQNVSKKVYAFSVEFFTQKKIAVIGETAVKVEMADNPALRIKGLSGREKLEDNSGMLFVFDKAEPYGIWMKEMNFSIDIIWFNEYGEVIHMVKNASPSSFPETFLPPAPSLYILEVPAGFVDKQHIKLGDLIDF